ncbi:MAG: SBBP repeat-containing protein [Planctomycetes bacterium]|nr:SBBP repeat-containing protein [Planctomycetota bacterium]
MRRVSVFALAIGTVGTAGLLVRAQTCTSVAGTPLRFSFHLGAQAEDTVRDIAVDAYGHIYLTGGTASANFPVTARAYDTTLDTRSGHVHDVFVAKLRPDGSIIWATYVGGPYFDIPLALEVDADGAVIVAGQAGPGFPTTPGSIQPAFGGDLNPDGFYGPQDGFVTKVAPDGSYLMWSTFFGQPDGTTIRDIALDEAGNVYLAMPNVQADNPHITPGAFESMRPGGGDGVVAKISYDGAVVEWATYLGGSGRDLGTPSIRLDDLGFVYVLGYTNSVDIPTTPGAFDRSYNGGGDLYVAKLLPDGSDLVFATYLGGSGVEFTETHGLALDARGTVYVAATTTSTDFPTTPGAFQRVYGGTGTSGKGANTNYPGDGFIAELSADGTRLLASTYVGGRYGEGIEGIGLGRDGSVFISGSTYSDNFPVSADGFQTHYTGRGDWFAAKFAADLSERLYASYLGGGEVDYGRTSTIDEFGNFYTAGHTQSSDWPVIARTRTYSGAAWDGAVAVFNLGTIWSQGDADADGDIDATDLAFFTNCFAVDTLAGPSAAACVNADINGDGCVNLADYHALVRTLRGPG